jgi:FkbM family methyltransferase
MEIIFAKVMHLITRNQYEKKTEGLAAGFVFRKHFLAMQNPIIRQQMSPEDQFLSKLNLKGKTVYDIGAHIGVHTLHFSRVVGQTGRVISFEPNPASFDAILAHLRVNSVTNVKAICSGIGDEAGTYLLVYREMFSGTGSMVTEIQRDIQEFSLGVRMTEVDVDTLDSYINSEGLPQPDFIKIDVEGMEYSALQGMITTCQLYKPKLFIELHGVSKKAKLENSQRIVNHLVSLNYEIFHIESKQKITLQNYEQAQIGHIYARPNSE